MAGTLAKLACMLFLCMVVAKAAMTCPQIRGGMVPCINYLSKGGSPSAACCTNLKNMVNSATTTIDRQDACKCLKEAAGALQGINPTNAARLPSNCKVNIPYKISMSTNCASVK
ncbi:non-specific lipid-transfer protein 1-like [Argentina anserina]|uniref:non-specific lipid-transfer protein 1-like n=1 Tax=Argentina anserina TaxID=57926 RepID=UPI002176318B|nr:non-specific lipid-transfer protein 1-like [Potentilla anserina]